MGVYRDASTRDGLVEFGERGWLGATRRGRFTGETEVVWCRPAKAERLVLAVALREGAEWARVACSAEGDEYRDSDVTVETLTNLTRFVSVKQLGAEDLAEDDGQACLSVEQAKRLAAELEAYAGE